MTMQDADIDRAATDILEALNARRQIAPLTRGAGGLSVQDAYRISRAVTALRRARGEVVVGRKIGFTNRTIWDEYGVHHPIDGPVYDTTVSHGAGPVSGGSVARFVEPRIEPEIVFGLSAAPSAGMDEAALLSCIGWMAHGFEVVQSLFPGWIFAGADCVAAFGLHGALFCGPRKVIEAGERAAVMQSLRAFEITLARDGREIDRGRAANVLGGPVLALGHLVEALAADPAAEPLKAGEIVTTGTLTRAIPIAPGERWTTRLDGLDLPGMDLTFAA